MKIFGHVVVMVVVALTWAAEASAQSAPTCTFDGASGVLTVTVNGGTTTVSVSATGAIQVDAVDCGGATTTSTASIQINGGPLIDTVILRGTFAPGLGAETDTPEIEIAFAIGEFTSLNYATVDLGSEDDVVRADFWGVDLNDDGDQDVSWATVQQHRINGQGGSDLLDGSGHLGGGVLRLYGGAGDDLLIGSTYRDLLYGGAGNDTIYGGNENDTIDGGAGADILYGEAGNDRFDQGTAPDKAGGDSMYGGAGRDLVSYANRSAAVTVTLGNGLADEGELGEGDFVAADVEGAGGGAGDDLLIGDSGPNTLKGSDGDDQLVGNDGDDILVGGLGNDRLEGGAGADRFAGQAGDDVFLNADGVAETVDCSVGLDDAEPDPLDTLVGCEL